MVHFSEDFVGGFFGFRRTYGASARFDAVAFVKAKVIVPPGSLAQELRGLYLRVYVFTPDMEHYLYAELFPEATGKPG
jgi:hypothetical protein